MRRPHTRGKNRRFTPRSGLRWNPSDDASDSASIVPRLGRAGCAIRADIAETGFFRKAEPDTPDRRPTRARHCRKIENGAKVSWKAPPGQVQRTRFARSRTVADSCREKIHRRGLRDFRCGRPARHERTRSVKRRPMRTFSTTIRTGSLLRRGTFERVACTVLAALP